jgi:hypothetical protein
MNLAFAKWPKEKTFVAAMFLLLTASLLLRHSAGFNWDFAVYELGGEWLCGKGAYFEWTRPPMASVIMCPLTLAGRAAAEYGLILFSMSLLVFSLWKLSKKEGIRSPEFLSLVLLTPFFFFQAMSNGTEALATGFLALSLYLWPRPLAGAAFAAAVLSRYTFIVFAPMFLFAGGLSARKAGLSILVFLLSLSPWLAFNFAMKGDPLFSLKDSFALNVAQRGYFDGPAAPADFLLATGFLLPALAVGIVSALRGIGNGVVLSKLKPHLPWFAWLLIAIFIYATTPFKDSRYLFPIVVPVAYFALQGINSIKKESLGHIFLAASLATNIFLLPLYPTQLEDPAPFREAAASLVGEACPVASNMWVYLNYFGISTEPIHWRPLMEARLAEGYVAAVYTKAVDFPDYSYLLEKNLSSRKVGDFIILRSRPDCDSPRPASYAFSYTEELARLEVLLR